MKCVRLKLKFESLCHDLNNKPYFYGPILHTKVPVSTIQGSVHFFCVFLNSFRLGNENSKKNKPVGVLF